MFHIIYYQKNIKQYNHTFIYLEKILMGNYKYDYILCMNFVNKKQNIFGYCCFDILIKKKIALITNVNYNKINLGIRFYLSYSFMDKYNLYSDRKIFRGHFLLC